MPKGEVVSLEVTAPPRVPWPLGPAANLVVGDSSGATPHLVPSPCDGKRITDKNSPKREEGTIRVAPLTSYSQYYALTDRGRYRVRYYIYVSDAKLEMLFPQIPRPLWERISLNVTLKSNNIDAQLGLKDYQIKRLHMLDQVERHLANNNLIGGPESGKQYIRARMDMRWMDIGGVIYWSGYFYDLLENRKRIVVDLGGSEKHVLRLDEGTELRGTRLAKDHDCLPTFMMMGSYVDSIIYKLRKPLAEDSRTDIDSPTKSDTSWENERWSASVVDYTAGEMFSSNAYGPTREVEFLAKTLLRSNFSSRQVILATPLYVAHV